MPAKTFLTPEPRRGSIIGSQTQLPVPTKFVVVIWHEAGRTVAAKKVMLSHFALQEAAE